ALHPGATRNRHYFCPSYRGAYIGASCFAISPRIRSDSCRGSGVASMLPGVAVNPANCLAIARAPLYGVGHLPEGLWFFCSVLTWRVVATQQSIAESHELMADAMAGRSMPAMYEPRH